MLRPWRWPCSLLLLTGQLRIPGVSNVKQSSSEERCPLVAIEPLSIGKNKLICIYAFHLTFNIQGLKGMAAAKYEMHMRKDSYSESHWCRLCCSNTPYPVAPRHSGRMTARGKYQLKVGKNTAQHWAQGCTVPIFFTHIELGTWGPGELCHRFPFCPTFIHHIHEQVTPLCQSLMQKLKT